jgi:hypothetical protein
MQPASTAVANVELHSTDVHSRPPRRGGRVADPGAGCRCSPLQISRILVIAPWPARRRLDATPDVRHGLLTCSSFGRPITPDGVARLRRGFAPCPASRTSWTSGSGIPGESPIGRSARGAWPDAAVGTASFQRSGSNRPSRPEHGVESSASISDRVPGDSGPGRTADRAVDPVAPPFNRWTTEIRGLATRSFGCTGFLQDS